MGNGQPKFAEQPQLVQPGAQGGQVDVDALARAVVQNTLQGVLQPQNAVDVGQAQIEQPPQVAQVGQAQIVPPGQRPQQQPPPAQPQALIQFVPAGQIGPGEQPQPQPQPVAPGGGQPQTQVEFTPAGNQQPGGQPAPGGDAKKKKKKKDDDDGDVGGGRLSDELNSLEFLSEQVKREILRSALQQQQIRNAQAAPGGGQ